MHQLAIEKLQNQLEKSSNEAKVVREHKNYIINALIQERDQYKTKCQEMDEDLFDAEIDDVEEYQDLQEENQKLQRQNKELKEKLLWDKKEKLSLEIFNDEFKQENQNLKRKIDNKISEESTPKKKKVGKKPRQAISWP